MLKSIIPFTAFMLVLTISCKTQEKGSSLHEADTELHPNIRAAVKPKIIEMTKNFQIFRGATSDCQVFARAILSPENPTIMGRGSGTTTEKLSGCVYACASAFEAACSNVYDQRAIAMGRVEYSPIVSLECSQGGGDYRAVGEISCADYLRFANVGTSPDDQSQNDQKLKQININTHNLVLPEIAELAKELNKYGHGTDRCEAYVTSVNDDVFKVGLRYGEATQEQSGCVQACADAFELACFSVYDQSELDRGRVAYKPEISLKCSVGGGDFLPIGEVSCIPYLMP